MNSFAVERADELAALESIYEDALSVISNEGLQKFDVCLHGHVGGHDRSDVECIIRFQYTERYPTEAPSYQVVKAKSLIAEDIATIESLMDSAIERSLGCIMIFDVLSEVQEKLNSICELQVAKRIKAEEDRKRAIEMEEEAKFRGDRVTVESFLAWNAKFLEELRQKSAENTKVIDGVDSKRLTGRELFLQDNRFDDSDLNFLVESGEAVDIDERLFADMGDIDLTDENEGLSAQVV